MVRSSSFKLMRWLSAALIAGIGIAFLVGGIQLTLLKSESNRMKSVIHEFMAFYNVVYEYKRAGQPPPDTLRQAVANDTTLGLRWIRSGIDPWGTAFSYTVVSKRRAGATDYEVTIRSFGPNRIDDQGASDDLQHIYLLTLYDDPNS